MTRITLKRSALAQATAAAVGFLAFSAVAQTQAEPANEETQLDEIVVTGSLIPRTELETATPVITISADDIRSRGFTNIAEVLKSTSFANGGVQGSQTSASFTQGAETISLFGLSVSYTKYLIDGRPMADYPALYNGSDAFNNISGIPVDLVERIEILPGGQSSLYGSDALAGVINIILKKNIESPIIRARVGGYTEGGGDTTRISAAAGLDFADGRGNVMFGLQYDQNDPIWAYDRELTRTFNRNGTSAPLASRDWLVYSPFTSYAFLDPARCANVTSGFEGSVGLQRRPGFGDELYCGSLNSPGYRTLKSNKQAIQAYTSATFDLNDNHQLYATVLYSDEETRYHVGANFTFWATTVEWGYFYDPRFDDLFNLQRAFVPEDFGPGGYERSMNTDFTESTNLTVGSRGTLGGGWDYDASLSYVDYTLNERGWARFADAINGYFQRTVLGPQQGLDPYYNAYPVFTPNYAAFYTLLPAGAIDTFTGFTDSRSKTSDSLARIQLTNTTLFTLPAGDVGFAAALEGGRQTWAYRPDARLLNGDIWGTTATDGAGERDRYAITSEFRLPVFSTLTASVSGRFDEFRPEGAESVNKATYSAGLEFRPIDTLLFRGKVGTAFKAPTLPDSFQAPSGFFSFVTDYFNCQALGFGPDNIDACPQRFSSVQYFGTTSGSPTLRPLTADVWSFGLVWAPTANLSFSADVYDWDIENEIQPQSADFLTLTEMRCRTGAPGFTLSSPICQNAINSITRNGQGVITEIFTPKVNEARQTLRAINLGASYTAELGSFGNLLVRATYTRNLDRESIAFEGDEPVDLLERPGFSSDPAEKADLSLTWAYERLATTAYVNWTGKTPNFRARQLDAYTGTAGLLNQWTTYNLSVNYEFSDNFNASLLVNNVTDEMPPFDATYGGNTGEPYNSSQYNAFGRSIFVEATFTF
ncbi:MAG: TonB-dependent receptor plug domain-containing protein [Silanimonas sp.]